MNREEEIDRVDADDQTDPDERLDYQTDPIRLDLRTHDLSRPELRDLVAYSQNPILSRTPRRESLDEIEAAPVRSARGRPVDPKYSFCPTYDEMAKRYTARSHSLLAESQRTGDATLLDKAKAYQRLAENMAAEAKRVLRARDWGITGKADR